MKVNNKPALEVKAVDYEYVTKNMGIYKCKPSGNTFLINIGNGCTLYYSVDDEVLEPADYDAWYKTEFIPLPNATLIFDVKE